MKDYVVTEGKAGITDLFSGSCSGLTVMPFSEIRNIGRGSGSGGKIINSVLDTLRLRDFFFFLFFFRECSIDSSQVS